MSMIMSLGDIERKNLEDCVSFCTSVKHGRLRGDYEMWVRNRNNQGKIHMHG